MVFDGELTYLIFPEYEFLIIANEYHFDPSDFHLKISLLVNDLVEHLAEVQTKSYTKMKIFNADLQKVTLEFNSDRKIVS